MVMLKHLNSLKSDFKQLFQADSFSKTSTGSGSHGYLMVTAKTTDFEVPRILRGSPPCHSSSPASSCRNAEIYDGLNETVGSGATGLVRLWRCRSNRKLVAVKEFRNQLPGEAKSQYDTRVVVEYGIGAALKHVNMIRVIELIKAQGRYFQVMEYAPYDLFAGVASKTMSSEEINCVFRQILAGLEYMHTMGFGHRDMKLDNILLDRNGIVKIIDFGCAVSCKELIDRSAAHGEGMNSSRPCVTNHSMSLVADISSSSSSSGFIGSDPYVGPEMFSTASYDARALDIWAAAIIFCVMILGRFPWGIAHHKNAAFREFWLQDTAMRTSSGAEVRRPTLLSQLPSESQPVIKGMLEIDAAQRLTCTMVLQSTWVKQIPFCYEDENKQYCNAGNHRHVLCKH